MRSVAQTADRDSLLYLSAYNYAIQTYHAALTPETGLYRGGQYVDYAYLISGGHPFLGEGKIKNGSVLYNGILYEHVPLLYDLVKQQVVTYNPANVFKIALINEQIDSFTIGQQIFIRLRDSLNRTAPRVGFYEQLYKGRITLLKKEKKTMEEDVSNPAEGVKHLVYTTIFYYIKKGDIYYPVNTKRSLLYALGSRSKEAKKFMRKNDLKMRDDKERTLLQISAWYDGLNS